MPPLLLPEEPRRFSFARSDPGLAPGAPAPPEDALTGALRKPGALIVPPETRPYPELPLPPLRRLEGGPGFGSFFCFELPSLSALQKMQKKGPPWEPGLGAGSLVLVGVAT